MTSGMSNSGCCCFEVNITGCGESVDSVGLLDDVEMSMCAGLSK